MRRILVPALAGIGAFLIVAAALMRFYAYPTLAVAPVDQNSITHLAAKNAVIFDSDPSVLKDITTDLSITNRTVGDVKASKGSLRCWGSTTSIKSSDGIVRSRSTERDGFDAVSGAAVKGCGDWVVGSDGEKTPVTRSGQVLKFPFDTQKKDYPLWVGDLGKALPAKYTGTSSIQGMTVYKFVQEVPDTATGTTQVPGSLFESTLTAAVTAENHTASTTTIYVEPATGAIVNRVSDQHSTLVYNGAEVVTTDAKIHYTQKQVDYYVDTLGTQSVLLSGMRGWIAVSALILGIILLAAGVLLRVTGRRSSGDPAPAAAGGVALTKDVAAG